MSFTVVKVEPTGTRQSTVLAKLAAGGCKWITADVPVYPQRPEAAAFHEARVMVGIGQRDMAARLGIHPRDLCDLEQGRAAFADPADWDRAIALLTEATP